MNDELYDPELVREMADSFVVIDRRAPRHRCTFPGGWTVIPDIPDHAIANMGDEGTIIRCGCGQHWIAERAGIGCWWRKISAFNVWLSKRRVAP